MWYRAIFHHCFFLFVCAASTAAADASITQARSQYSDAVVAIDRGAWIEYARLRSALDDYPLAIYLDYRKLARNPAAVSTTQALDFLQRAEDSPLPNRFLAAYLQRAGRDKRWSDFLAVKPDEPNAVELKCYYFRAQLASGNKQQAFDGAARLWLHGRSQPKACDPLFANWMKAGQLTDELVWQRMLLAFEARQRSLMSYVSRQATAGLKPWADKLLSVYRSPEKIRRISLPANSIYSADIASYGLAYLARYKPEQALQHWQHYQQQLNFNEDQARRVEYQIAREALFDEDTALLPWVEQQLGKLGDTELIEIRLRWALAEKDWAGLLRNMKLLPAERSSQAVWRYWQAVALREQGGSAQAYALALQQLAQERGYYGFLAAQELGQPYAFNQQAASAAAVDPSLLQLPAVARISELNYHDQNHLAHSEWSKVLGDNPEAAMRQRLAQMAADQGWERMAIDAANQAKAWDRLDLRFPTPYSKVFERYARSRQVPATELMSIARRESAFFPQARSPVGARGLMQIMPATGKQVAKSLGQSHRRSQLYEVEHNVLLGSAYYRQLLDRYQGNRIFALAAYNAGPHRVDRWIKPGQQKLDAQAWIETIPFRETRNYVQAVLSYNVVFAFLQGMSQPLLTPGERQRVY